MADDQALSQPPPKGLQQDMLRLLRHYGPPQVLRALVAQMPRAAAQANADRAREAYQVVSANVHTAVKLAQVAWGEWLDALEKTD